MFPYPNFVLFVSFTVKGRLTTKDTKSTKTEIKLNTEG